MKRIQYNPLHRHSRSPIPGFSESSAQSGQALAEFVVGLIALLALISCLCVGTTLITGHTEAMTTARQEAARACLLEGDTMSGAQYIIDWTPWTNPFETRNPNKRFSKYTKYDTAKTAIPDLNGLILDKAVVADSDWDIIAQAPDSKFTKLRGTKEFGLVKGYGSASIPIDKTPFIPHFFGITKIDVECTAWLPQINGMY